MLDVRLRPQIVKAQRRETVGGFLKSNFKAMEACSKLKREFDESLGEHVISETELRHENIRLETEISQMIKE